MLLSLALGPPPPASPPPQASVVRVESRSVPVNHKGSGVVVAPGTIATNAHVVSEGGEVSVVQGSTRWKATLLRWDAARDLALLHAPGCPLPAASLAEDGAVQEGQTVVSFSYPGGGPLVRTEGRILALWTFQGARMLQAELPARPGSSGGGLFDGEGRLVGLTTFGYPDRPTATFALPTLWIRSLTQGDAASPAASPTPFLAEAFASAMANTPDNWEVWERFCRAWTQEAPKDPDGWMALGHALELAEARAREAGAPPGPSQAESLAAYQRALQLREGHARTWNNLGSVLESDNRYAEAERAFRRAVELDPDYGLGWINLGTTYFNTYRYAPAVEAFRRGLGKVPDHATAWSCLGYSLLRLRRYPESVQALLIATRYRPFRGDLWEDLAAAARGAKDPATAALATAKARALRTSR